MIKSMEEWQIPLCFPQLARKEEKQFAVKALYNPLTVQTLNGKPFLPHDITFDEKGGFYILTGANQGGKTVLLKSVGIAQIMAQLGLPVPCRSARISPVDGLFTHLPAGEETRASVSRFADECKRMQRIAAEVSEYSLVLMDETFSGSAAEEAVDIAEEVLRAFGIIGCRGIFSTHLHRLAAEIGILNGDPGVRSRFDSLVMSRSGYRLARMTPEGRSYAGAVAEKYGLSTEQILHGRRQEKA